MTPLGPVYASCQELWKHKWPLIRIPWSQVFRETKTVGDWNLLSPGSWRGLWTSNSLGFSEAVFITEYEHRNSPGPCALGAQEIPACMIPWASTA